MNKMPPPNVTESVPKQGTARAPVDALLALKRAMNAHDIEAMTACFRADYESEIPAHPDRAFRGVEPMRRNWTQIFAAVPDFEAVLLKCSAEGDVVWAEWEWRGTRADRSPHRMRGVTVQGIQDGRIAWVRLYMEPVRVGQGSDAALRQALAPERRPEQHPAST